MNPSIGMTKLFANKAYLTRDNRYLLSFQVGDHTGQAWLQAFNEVGAEIIGMSADELIKLRVSRFLKADL